MLAKVVGITRGVRKETGKRYTVLHVITDFEDWLADNSEGNAVTTLYISKNVDVNVGDTIKPIYGVGYQGKAIVVDILISED